MIVNREQDACGRRAFTLLELTIGIALVGLLLALFLPAIGSARASAKRLQCVNALKQITLATANYDASFETGPHARHLIIDLASFLETAVEFEWVDGPRGLPVPKYETGTP